jgi:hypothetical protein
LEGAPAGRPAPDTRPPGQEAPGGRGRKGHPFAPTEFPKVRSAAEDRSGHGPPRTATYAPQEEDTAGRSRPEAATGQGLPPSVFVRMIAIGQPSTDLSTAGRDDVPTGLLMSGTGAPGLPTHYRPRAQPLQCGQWTTPVPWSHSPTERLLSTKIRIVVQLEGYLGITTSGPGQLRRPNHRSLEHTWGRSRQGMYRAGPPGEECPLKPSPRRPKTPRPLGRATPSHDNHTTPYTRQTSTDIRATQRSRASKKGSRVGVQRFHCAATLHWKRGLARTCP